MNDYNLNMVVNKESVEQPTDTMDGDVNPVVQLMANMLNYLNVSLYEGQFTLKDEQSRRRLNEIYDTYARNTELIIKHQPNLCDITEFYRNIKDLRNVTDTDDPDYNHYVRLLCHYIRSYNK
jgi:hypothetical protein